MVFNRKLDDIWEKGYPSVKKDRDKLDKTNWQSLAIDKADIEANCLDSQNSSMIAIFDF